MCKKQSTQLSEGEQSDVEEFCKDTFVEMLNGTQQMEIKAIISAYSARLREENQRLEDALQRIKNWSEAYPLEVFPEPDLLRSAEVLKAAGLSLDSISAYNMRHCVQGVGNIASNALSKTPLEEK